MTFTLSLTAIAAVTLPLLLVLRSIFRAATSPLRHIPGPLEARFTRFWYFRRVWAGAFPYVNIDLHRKYGPIVRIAPNQYSIDSPDAAKQLYGAGAAFLKSEWYEGWKDPRPGVHRDLFTDRDPKRHAAYRRLIASLYSMTGIVQFEDKVDANTALLVRKFKEMAKEKNVFNLEHWLQCYAFDVIGAISVGESFRLLETGDDKNMFINLDGDANLNSIGGIYRELQKPLISVVMALQLPNPFTPIVEFGEKQLAKRIRRQEQQAKSETTTTGENGDFLGNLLKKHDEDPEKYTMKLIMATLFMNIGAGSDTTSISLSAVMYHLIKNPRALEKLRSEISEATMTGKASEPITFQQSQQLHYLQAVIKEALRLHPATGLTLDRVVPAEGAQVAGQSFPAGSQVGINTWVAHHNTDIFGEDASEFRPERWLQGKEEVSRLDAYYLTFGNGSRGCIGKNISMLEMSKLMPELVMRFDFEFADPHLKLETKNVWFVKQTNLSCRVKVRSE